MKNIIILVIALISISNITFSQDKIKPDLKTITFLGRVPQKVESNALPDNVLRMLYFRTQPDSNSKIGYMNKEGEILVQPIYNMGSDYYGNNANIIKDSIFGYIDKEGNETLFSQYDETFFYYGDTGIARKNGKYGLIDRSGDSLTTFQYKMIKFFGFNHFTAVTQNKKDHLLDTKGNIIFNDSLIFDIRSHYFESDSSIVYQEKIGGKKLKGLVSLDGRILLKPKYQEIYFINDEDFYLVEREQKWGFINKSGEEVIPLIYEEAGFNVRDDLIPVKKSGKWGFINRKNEVIIPFIYDEAHAFTNGLAFVKKGDKYGCIDRNNKVKIKIKLEKTGYPFFSNNLALFKKGDKYGFRNKRGKVKIPAIYDLAYPFINEMACVELNGKVGYINKKGKEVIPIKYTQLWFESEEMIRFIE